MVFLIAQRATKIDVISNLSNEGEIGIETINGFSVNYAEDGEHCKATLHAGLMAQGKPEMLNIQCVMEGEFMVDKIISIDDKKRIHVNCYQILFPYAQALVTRLCTDAGLPPFYLQPVKMTIDDVIVNE